MSELGNAMILGALCGVFALIIVGCLIGILAAWGLVPPALVGTIWLSAALLDVVVLMVGLVIWGIFG